MPHQLVRPCTSKQIHYLQPAVEAGQKRGFKQTMRLIEKHTTEISPLAYMRGRASNHALVLCDEAQNRLLEQMKMF